MQVTNNVRAVLPIPGTKRRRGFLWSVYAGAIMAEPPNPENKPPEPTCVACGHAMTFITTIADPLLKHVRLFECPRCQNTAFIKE